MNYEQQTQRPIYKRFGNFILQIEMTWISKWLTHENVGTIALQISKAGSPAKTLFDLHVSTKNQPFAVGNQEAHPTHPKIKSWFSVLLFPHQFWWFSVAFPEKKKAGWWLGHPSEKYEFVNWDEDRFPILMGQFKKWQPVTTNQKWFPEISSRGPSRIKHRPIQKLRTRRAAGNSFSEASRTCFLFRFWGPGRHGRMSREPGVLGNWWIKFRNIYGKQMQNIWETSKSPKSSKAPLPPRNVEPIRGSSSISWLPQAAQLPRWRLAEGSTA